MQDLSTIRGDSSSAVPPSVTVRTSSKQSQPKTSRSASEGTGSSGKCRCYFQCCVVWNITQLNEVMQLAGIYRNRPCRQHIPEFTGHRCCWVSWHLREKTVSSFDGYYSWLIPRARLEHAREPASVLVTWAEKLGSGLGAASCGGFSMRGANWSAKKGDKNAQWWARVIFIKASLSYVI